MSAPSSSPAHNKSNMVNVHQSSQITVQLNFLISNVHYTPAQTTKYQNTSVMLIGKRFLRAASLSSELVNFVVQ